MTNEPGRNCAGKSEQFPSRVAHARGTREISPRERRYDLADPRALSLSLAADLEIYRDDVSDAENHRDTDRMSRPARQSTESNFHGRFARSARSRIEIEHEGRENLEPSTIQSTSALGDSLHWEKI